jgi:HK97 family phage prohead protease|tara:strand:- start:571 stop:1419 length:849 start_codon:yes stop_codon:yes gene_type:complete
MNSNYTNAENILSCRTSEYTSIEDSIKNEAENIVSDEETQQVEIDTIDDEEISIKEEYLQVKSEIKLTKIDEVSEEYGTFEGYASVFENTDLGNDVIKTGAFKKSLRKRTYKGIKLLYQHKSDMPIGVFDEIKEDAHGLYVKGRLALKTATGRDAYELLKLGALDAMSIGFRANPDEISYDKRSQKRTIGEVDLLEISLVTFPMNPQALVRSVKADKISIREWENGMRDAFTLSRSEAKVAAKAVYQVFEEKKNSEMLDGLDANMELVDAIKNLTLTLTTSN